MKKRPGRPVLEKSDDARQAIVDAAVVHFARDGIKGSSNRQIALTAQRTPALVHYYFANRETLFEAVLQASFGPLVGKLAALDTLAVWVHAFHAHLVSHPWLPHLMIREVLPANGQLRELFLANQAPRIYGSVRPLVAALIHSRKSRSKPDIDRHVMLLMGMLVYPFLGQGIGQEVSGRKFDHAMLEGFRDDALKLFLTGLAPQERK